MIVRAVSIVLRRHLSAAPTDVHQNQVAAESEKKWDGTATKQSTLLEREGETPRTMLPLLVLRRVGRDRLVCEWVTDLRDEK
jgi:hypothetical protein